jgi:hypothetical protein
MGLASGPLPTRRDGEQIACGLRRAEEEEKRKKRETRQGICFAASQKIQVPGSWGRLPATPCPPPSPVVAYDAGQQMRRTQGEYRLLVLLRLEHASKPPRLDRDRRSL